MAEGGAEDIPPDAAETVDADLNRYWPSRGQREVRARGRTEPALRAENGMLGASGENVNAWVEAGTANRALCSGKREIS